jgi:hypothetical protein
MMGDVGTYGNYFVAAIFFVVGLHLLDVIPLPFSGPGQVGMKRRGAFAAFVLGLVFGIALGPCTFAYMAPMLAITFRLAATNIAYGVLLLLAYGLGHCSVIVLAGTFTSAVQRYLRWNERSRGAVYLRWACGVLVLAGGVYLIYVAPWPIMKYALAACALGAVGLCVALGCTRDPSPPDGTVPAVRTDAASAPAGQSVAGAEPSKVIAFYFHRTVRCQSCLAIEDISRQAIEAGFIDALGDGRLEWRPLNLDEAENAHFEKDFELTTQSLVLATIQGAKVIEWRNLKDVWKLLDNPVELERYVHDEVAKYLGVRAAK